MKRQLTTTARHKRNAADVETLRQSVLAALRRGASRQEVAKRYNISERYLGRMARGERSINGEWVRDPQATTGLAGPSSAGPSSAAPSFAAPSFAAKSPANRQVDCGSVFGKIRDLARRGLGNEDIAKLVGLTPREVRHALGVPAVRKPVADCDDPAPLKPVRQFGLEEHQVIEARRLYGKGWSVAALVRRYSIGPEQAATLVGAQWQPGAQLPTRRSTTDSEVF